MAGPDASYQFLACRYLRDQLDALTRELGGVRRNDDIEPVHQARVASRRLRAALSMFADCFNVETVANWRKRIKKLTRGLGAARDADVQIAFVRRFLSNLDEKDWKHRPGVERLLLRLQQQRDTLQPQIVAILDKIDRRGTLAEMAGDLERTLFVLRSHDVHLQSAFVFERAAAHIRKRKEELLTTACVLSDSQDARGHHQMRIAAKRLRYTMEICAPAYDDELKTFISSIKRVQTLLGDVHDCDVWSEHIETFMEHEQFATIQYYGHSRPFLRLRSGLLLIREERQECRRRTFAELLDFWKSLEQEYFWDAMENTLEKRLNDPDYAGHEPQGKPTSAGTE